jgi:hypothetical protein
MAKVVKQSVGDLINAPKKVGKSLVKSDFSLDELDEFLGSKPSGWKPPMNLSVCKAVEDAVNVDNLIQMGQCSMLLGLSDVGKSQMLALVAIACQKNNILPIFIITELKWSFSHLRDMGFEMDETVDEDTGEIIYSGDFIYRDSSVMLSVEQCAEFMLKCLKAQREGKLNRNIMFCVDTFGNLSCDRAIETGKVSPLWDASAYNQWFHKGVCREVNLTRKSNFPYYAGMVAVNHAWVNNRISEYGSIPTLEPSGGLGYYKSCQTCLQFGDTTKVGSTMVKATKNGKDVNFGKRTKVTLRKFHGEGCSVKAKVIIVKEGFITDSPESIKEYTKSHSKEWIKNLGIQNDTDMSFDIIDEDKDLID